MIYSYKTKNTCATEITFNIEDDVIRNISFTNGCNGNLKAIGQILDGFTVSQIIEKCANVECGNRGTSCADQLSIAVGKAHKEIVEAKENGI